MTTENWTLEKGLCRCCHAEGNFKSLACVDYGQELIYADMLKNCFNINLAPVPGILCVLTYTICSACIAKLSDAVKFKKEVARCEEKFKEFFNKNLIKAPGSVIEVPVKKELPHSCNGDDFSLQDDNKDSFDDLPDYGYDDDDNDDDMAVKEEQLDSSNDGSSILKSMLISPKENVKKKSKKGQKSKTQTKKKGRPKKIKEEPIAEEGEERKNFATETASYYTFDRAEDGSHNYTCTSCVKTYKTLSSVVQHYRHVHLHLRPKLRSCYYCEVRVPGHMRAYHLEKEHGIPAPTCNACGKKFAFPFLVLRHQKLNHMGEKKFSCKICNMQFASQGSLTQHSIKHSAVRVHKCEHCDKSFKWKKNLKTHIMMHLDVRRHVCNACNEAFVQQSSLKYHITKRHPELI